jgi:hypothetical protein
VSTVLAVIFLGLGVAAAYTGMPWFASGTLYVVSGGLAALDWEVAE